MDSNFFSLHEDNTEASLFGSSDKLLKVSVMGITVSDVSIIPSSSVKNLGIVQGCIMSMSAHISRLCSSPYLHLRNMSRICPFLS